MRSNQSIKPTLIMKKIVFLFCLMLLCSCFSNLYTGRYQISLTEVMRPSDNSNQYGQLKVSESDGKYTYSDDILDIVWSIGYTQLDFALTNKSMYNMQIVWDEAIYVDQTGQSGKIMHAGIRYTDKGQPMANTSVAASSTLSDCIIPVSSVRYGQYTGWFQANLLPSFHKEKQVVLDTANSLIGSYIRVVMPIMIQGVKNEYTFVFKVNGFTPSWQ